MYSHLFLNSRTIQGIPVKQHNLMADVYLCLRNVPIYMIPEQFKDLLPSDLLPLLRGFDGFSIVTYQGIRKGSKNKRLRLRLVLRNYRICDNTLKGQDKEDFSRQLSGSCHDLKITNLNFITKTIEHVFYE